MNTLKKGDDFEDKVFKYIEEELSNDRLHVPGNRSKIYKKKGYHSKDRNSDIITDISIETFRLDAYNASDESRYSLLTIIECKDYSATIPVNEIEEFYSKIQQISGANVKAIFATNSSLQKSALNYAKSKMMAVIRFLPVEQIECEWKSDFLTSVATSGTQNLNQSEFNSAFLNQYHKSDGREIYACDCKYIYPNLSSILKEYLNTEEHQ